MMLKLAKNMRKYGDSAKKGEDRRETSADIYRHRVSGDRAEPRGRKSPNTCEELGWKPPPTWRHAAQEYSTRIAATVGKRADWSINPYRPINLKTKALSQITQIFRRLNNKHLWLAAPHRLKSALICVICGQLIFKSICNSPSKSTSTPTAAHAKAVPRLMETLQRHNAQATFCFLARPGSHRARHQARVSPRLCRQGVAYFGVEQLRHQDLLYGTLLPGPDIGRNARRSCAARAMRALRPASIVTIISAGRSCGGQGASGPARDATRSRSLHGNIREAPHAHAAAGWQTNRYALRLTQRILV